MFKKKNKYILTDKRLEDFIGFKVSVLLSESRKEEDIKD